MIHLAQEIWDKVVRNLPSFSIRPAAQVFGFKLERKQENHLNVWNVIFQDQVWLDKAVEHGLNPTLIGTGLTVNHNHRRAASAIYICLCTGPDTFTYPKTNFELLLNCLRPHSLDPSTQEIKFKCGIVLNISQIRGHNGVIAPPMRVLSYRHHSLRSSYMSWEDNTHSLRYIGWPRRWGLFCHFRFHRPQLGRRSNWRGRWTLCQQRKRLADTVLFTKLYQ